MMMYVSVFKLNERKNNAKQIAVLKQEIDGLGATNQAKQLAKQAAEKNAMVNKAIVDSVPQLKSYYKQQVGLNSLPALSIREIKKNLVISQVMAQAHDARQLINSGIFMLLKEA